MENDYLFDYAEKAMVEALKGAADRLKSAKQSWEFSDLFHIANKDLMVLKAADNCAQKYVVDICTDLIIQLLDNYGIAIKTKDLPSCVDFCIETGSGIMGYVVTYNFQHIFDVAKLKEAGLCGLTVIALQDTLIDNYKILRPNSRRYKESGSANYVNNVILRQFLSDMGINEYENFKLYADRYEFDAQEAVGINTTIVPTEKALSLCKEKVENELLSWEYLSELGDKFSDHIDSLKKNVQRNSRIVIGDDDFAKSILSSEWYFDLQVKTDRGLDQTAIVAGYLKSVEQFLLSLIKVSSRRWKVFVEHKKLKNEDGSKKWFIFKEQYIKDYNLTLGAINKCLTNKNNKFFNQDEQLTKIIINFIEEYCMYTRNGYLHKDNLYKWEEIEKIRKKTYCVYFLLLGNLFINNDIRDELIRKAEILVEEEKKLDYEAFATWISEIMCYNDNIDYRYFFFKLMPGYYSGRHSLMIMGANEYCDNNLVFNYNDAIPRIVERFVHTPFEWSSKTPVSDLKEEATVVIQKYLSEGEYSSSLKKYDAIMVGDFGDIDIIYKK